MTSTCSSIPVITIDGPTASGKGTVARQVAQALGFHYLDSGALYRLVALSAQRQHLADETEAEATLAKLAAALDCRFIGDAIFLGNEDVSQAIRSEETGNKASRIATLPAVRRALLDLQIKFRTAPGLVADGRDMGTVVFPDANLKVFLTARVEVRAQRRYKQLIGKEFSANIDVLLKDLQERDARDANRLIAPLKPAKDAFLLDASDMNVVQAGQQVLGQYRARCAI